MQHGSRRILLLLGLAAFAAVVGGCKKNVSSTPPAPAPAPAAAEPTVTLNASPATVNLARPSRSRGLPRTRQISISNRASEACRHRDTRSKPDAVDHLHDYGHGRGRQRHGNSARGCKYRATAATCRPAGLK